MSFLYRNFSSLFIKEPCLLTKSAYALKQSKPASPRPGCGELMGDEYFISPLPFTWSSISPNQKDCLSIFLLTLSFSPFMTNENMRLNTWARNCAPISARFTCQDGFEYQLHFFYWERSEAGRSRSPSPWIPHLYVSYAPTSSIFRERTQAFSSSYAVTRNGTEENVALGICIYGPSPPDASGSTTSWRFVWSPS